MMVGPLAKVGAKPPVELKLHGQRACRAAFEARPDDIVRAYVGEELVNSFRDLLHGLAQARKPYRVVRDEELEALTESTHHEGICVVMKPRAPLGLDKLVRVASGPAVLVGLVGVGNPHNVGAILRIAAHFGAAGMIVEGEQARLPPAAHRTAEGGAEWVPVSFVESMARALAVCRAAGFAVCATSSHDGRDLYAAPLPGRVVLLLGSETTGLPRELVQGADLTLRVPGTGRVESLNVASAATVLLSEFWRAHGERAKPPRGV